MLPEENSFGGCFFTDYSTFVDLHPAQIVKMIRNMLDVRDKIDRFAYDADEFKRERRKSLYLWRIMVVERLVKIIPQVQQLVKISLRHTE